MAGRWLSVLPLGESESDMIALYASLRTMFEGIDTQKETVPTTRIVVTVESTHSLTPNGETNDGQAL